MTKTPALIGSSQFKGVINDFITVNNSGNLALIQYEQAGVGVGGGGINANSIHQERTLHIKFYNSMVSLKSSPCETEMSAWKL